MAASGKTIGTAYLAILPEISSLKKSIAGNAKNMEKSFSQSEKRISKSIDAGISKSIKSGAKSGFSGFSKSGISAAGSLAKGMSSAITKGLAGASASAASAGLGIGKSIASGVASQTASLSSTLVSTVKGAAITAGAAFAGVMGVSVAKGFQRLSAIDEAKSKLAGLGNSASDVSSIMDSAKKSVEGTAFGLGEAAAAAATSVAAGIKPGKELDKVLGTMSDTAAIAGASLGDISLIYGSIASMGKLQAQDAMQLMQRGIPVWKLLSEEVGVSVAEVRKLSEDGKIDFATFERAMARGVGGAAKKMGNTFKGSMSNMNAAMGRFGATLATPVFDNAPRLFNVLTKTFDKLEKAVKPVVDDVSKRLMPAFDRFLATIENKVNPGLDSFVLNAYKKILRFKSTFVRELSNIKIPKLKFGGLKLPNFFSKDNLYKQYRDAMAGMPKEIKIPKIDLSFLDTAFSVAKKLFPYLMKVGASAMSVTTGAFNLLKKAMDKVNPESKTFLDVIKDIGDGYHKMIDGTKAFVNWVTPAFSAVYDHMKATRDYIGGVITSIQNIAGQLSPTGQAIADIFGAVGREIWQLWSYADTLKWDWLSKAFSSVDGSSAINWINQVSTSLSESLVPAIDKIDGYVERFVSGLSSKLGAAAAYAAPRLSQLWTDSLPHLQALWEGLKGFGGVLVDLGNRMSEAFAQNGGTDLLPVLLTTIFESLLDIVPRVLDTIAQLLPEVSNLFSVISDQASVSMVQMIIDVIKLIIAMMPVMVNVMTGVSEFINTQMIPAIQWLADLLERHPGIIQAIIAGFIAFKSVMFVVGIVTSIAGAFFKVWGAIKMVFNIVRILGIAFMTPPIGLVVVLAAAVGALVYFFTQTEKGKEILAKFWEYLKQAFQWISDVIMRFVDTVMSIPDKISSLKDSMVQKFEDVKNGIKAVWQGVEDILMAPVRLFEDAMSKVGIDFFKVKDVSSNPALKGKQAFKTGGVLPGYTPGRDVHRFYSATGGILDMSGGEAIMVPEFVKQAGGAKGIAALNAAARKGQKFNNGGVYTGKTLNINLNGNQDLFTKSEVLEIIQKSHDALGNRIRIQERKTSATGLSAFTSNK